MNTKDFHNEIEEIRKQKIESIKERTRKKTAKEIFAEAYSIMDKKGMVKITALEKLIEKKVKK